MIQYRVMIFMLCVLFDSMHAISSNVAEKQEINTATNEASSKTHGLLIFLDEMEAASQKGAIQMSLLTAIIEQAFPIIVSASSILNLKANLLKGQLLDEKELLEKMQSYSAPQVDSPYEDDFFRSILALNLKTDWVIKEIDNTLYLLLPLKYLISKNAFLHSDVYLSTPQVTEVERDLGLKINHMRTIHFDKIKKSWKAYFKSLGHYLFRKPMYSDYFIDVLFNKVQNTSSIFVTNKEYANHEHLIPKWALCIMGHGTFAKSIAGIHIKSFQEFLFFLQHKIHTKILYYVSCYAAGMNSKLAYEESGRLISKTYSFPIVMDAIPDRTLMASFDFNMIMTFKPKISIQLNYPRYAHLLKELTKPESIDYLSVANIIVSFYNRVGFIGSLPQVKLPGLEWFSVIDDEVAISIGDVLAATRTKPLSITNFFAKRGKKAQPQAILLYARDIPFEIILDTQKCPAFISMIAGNVEHYIKKLSSSLHDVYEIMNSFLFSSYLATQKIFKIDEISGKNSKDMNRLLNREANEDEMITLKSVVISPTYPKKNNKKGIYISFTYNDVRYDDVY